MASAEVPQLDDVLVRPFVPNPSVWRSSVHGHVTLESVQVTVTAPCINDLDKGTWTPTLVNWAAYGSVPHHRARTMVLCLEAACKVAEEWDTVFKAELPRLLKEAKAEDEKMTLVFEAQSKEQAEKRAKEEKIQPKIAKKRQSRAPKSKTHINFF